MKNKKEVVKNITEKIKKAKSKADKMVVLADETNKAILSKK